MIPRYRFLGALARAGLVCAFVGAHYFAYQFCVDAFAELVGIPGDPSLVYAALLLQGLLTAGALTLLFVYPLAYVFRQRASVVAAAMVAPVLALQIAVMLDAHYRAVTNLILSLDVLMLALLLVGGAWLVSRANVKTV
ncbi:MAG: hypothetical protein V4754_18110 [Pseudomonadota bacterium]